MAGPFPPGTPLLAKRFDGSTILLTINPMEGLSELLERIGRHEVCEHTLSSFVFVLGTIMDCLACLSFLQAMVDG